MTPSRPSRNSTDRASHWPRATLRTHLVAIILAATLPLALFMSFRIVAEGQRERESSMASLRSTARAVAMLVDRELTASRDALNELAQADSLQRGDLVAFEQRLRARGRLRPGWSRLAVLEGDGRRLFEVGAANALPGPTTADGEIEALARAWARRSSGSVLLSVLDVAAPQRATWVGVGTTTADGGRRLLAARVELAVWQALIEGAMPEGDGYVALFDQQHRVLARTVAPQQSAGRALPASAVAGMVSRASGAQIAERLGEGPTYVGWHLLGDGGWGVGAGVTGAEFDAAQNSAALWTFGVAAACLLLGVTLALALARRVVLPLQRLLRSRADLADEPIAVTEIAQLRDALQLSERARDELMAFEKIARRDAEAAGRAKDQLLAMLGHELRNPLNGIVTSVEVLRAAAPGSAMADDARGVLSRQVRKLTRMVDDLLDVGQAVTDPVTLERRPIDLPALLGRSVDAATARADAKRQRLQVDAAVPVWIDADADRIEQVMAHLLENAIKYTPAGGAVSVRLALLEGQAVVSVEDNGAGVDAELLRRVFDPFVQGERGLDRSTGGLGIGLALVKRLVGLHGGSVHAHSSPQGSNFGWRLPAIAAPDPSAPAVVLQIAVVDDDADALASMRAMLELEGHRVSTAVDGQSAVAMLLADRPDVALIDIGLPGFDGHEVARRCRAAGFLGRLIAISGYGQARDLEHSAAEGFDAHLVKPLDRERLLPLLRST